MSSNMSPGVTSVVYELRDCNNIFISDGSVEINTARLIDALKVAVYDINKSRPQLANCGPTNLSVYPPSSVNPLLTTAAAAKTKIGELFDASRSDDSVILIIHPPKLYVSKQQPTPQLLAEWFNLFPSRHPNIKVALKPDSEKHIAWQLDPYNDNWKLISREEAKVNLVQRLFTRWEIRREISRIKYEDRTHNPLLATHGAPGCGE